jgi:hypothetical protein
VSRLQQAFAELVQLEAQKSEQSQLAPALESERTELTASGQVRLQAAEVKLVSGPFGRHWLRESGKRAQQSGHRVS